MTNANSCCLHRNISLWVMQNSSLSRCHCVRKIKLHSSVCVTGSRCWCLAENSWYVSATCKCLQSPCVCSCFLNCPVKKVKNCDAHHFHHSHFQKYISNQFSSVCFIYCQFTTSASLSCTVRCLEKFLIFWQYYDEHHAHHKSIFFCTFFCTSVNLSPSLLL